MQFDGKRVLITGSARGIGQATARVFLERGARVAINDLTEEAVTRSIFELGGKGCAAAPGDIATVAGAEAVVAQAIERLGGLDILINNAGIFREASIEETDEAIWDATMNVNLKGLFFTSRAALAELKRQKGVIVNIASEAGVIGTPAISAYSASKAGVIGLTRALAMELVPDVRVACICPAPTNTPLFDDILARVDDPAAYRKGLAAYTPLGRIAEPEEVAKAVAFLASSDASLVTGTALMVEGGVTAGKADFG
ncbi:MAG: SDR family oxidoreductase [Proteobacteria bacterium]|nr:SDR family oxidoreductase [Pseudomonadota bacterium]